MQVKLYDGSIVVHTCKICFGWHNQLTYRTLPMHDVRQQAERPRQQRRIGQRLRRLLSPVTMRQSKLLVDGLTLYLLIQNREMKVQGRGVHMTIQTS